MVIDVRLYVWVGAKSKDSFFSTDNTVACWASPESLKALDMEVEHRITGPNSWDHN